MKSKSSPSNSSFPIKSRIPSSNPKAPPRENSRGLPKRLACFCKPKQNPSLSLDAGETPAPCPAPLQHSEAGSDVQHAEFFTTTRGALQIEALLRLHALLLQLLHFSSSPTFRFPSCTPVFHLQADRARQIPNFGRPRGLPRYTTSISHVPARSPAAPSCPWAEPGALFHPTNLPYHRFPSRAVPRGGSGLLLCASRVRKLELGH